MFLTYQITLTCSPILRDSKIRKSRERTASISLTKHKLLGIWTLAQKMWMTNTRNITSIAFATDGSKYTNIVTDMTWSEIIIIQCLYYDKNDKINSVWNHTTWSIISNLFRGIETFPEISRTPNSTSFGLVYNSSSSTLMASKAILNKKVKSHFNKGKQQRTLVWFDHKIPENVEGV